MIMHMISCILVLILLLLIVVQGGHGRRPVPAARHGAQPGAKES